MVIGALWALYHIGEQDFRGSWRALVQRKPSALKLIQNGAKKLRKEAGELSWEHFEVLLKKFKEFMDRESP